MGLKQINIIDILRGPKLFEFVIFDWISTLLGALILAKLFDFNYLILLIILLIISIYLHIEFEIPTMTNYYLGLSDMPNRD